LKAELKKVDVTKGNNYEEVRDECRSANENMDLEYQTGSPIVCIFRYC